MRYGGLGLWLALLVVGLAACTEDSSIMAPQDVGQIEVELMIDEDINEAIIRDAEASLAAVFGGSAGGTSRGATFVDPDPSKIDEARQLLEQAREKFRQARRAWAGGDSETAAERALEGRLLVAEALVLVFGEEAYDRLLERVDHVISWLEERVDEEASEMLDRIRELRVEAEALREMDVIAASERLILAMHIAHRERIHHRRQEITQHARFSIYMAQAAVELAGRYVGEDATERQQHALRHAEHLVQDAILALEAERFRLAFALAREAENVALVAVVLEPDIIGEQVPALIGLSERALAAAEEALASSDPNPFAERLLLLAKDLQARGVLLADELPRRAVHILWHASVVAYGVAGLVS
ncbi:MAG: hypothetical protein JSU87_12425 [Gemmatimonadota bacterium]|nr:MAG: hypothetical protein JSU87_12425 [Gemmatimonadota bacterium]